MHVGEGGGGGGGGGWTPYPRARPPGSNPRPFFPPFFFRFRPQFRFFAPAPHPSDPRAWPPPFWPLTPAHFSLKAPPTPAPLAPVLPDIYCPSHTLNQNISGNWINFVFSGILHRAHNKWWTSLRNGAKTGMCLFVYFSPKCTLGPNAWPSSL